MRAVPKAAAVAPFIFRRTALAFPVTLRYSYTTDKRDRRTNMKNQKITKTERALFEKIAADEAGKKAAK